MPVTGECGGWILSLTYFSGNRIIGTCEKKCREGEGNMGRKKNFLMVLLALTVLLSVVFGVFWNLRHYTLVDFRFYPKGLQQLDLRDREISVRHYEKLLSRMPECEILWNVPFQGNAVPWDTKEITISALSREDMKLLSCFDGLERIHAEDCTDYENLLELYRNRPDLQVEYTVCLGGEGYPVDTERLVLEAAGQEETSLLGYLPNLKRVLCTGGQTEDLFRLRDYCREQQVVFSVVIGEKNLSPDVKTATVSAVTDRQIGLLQLFSNLEQLHLQQPEASAETLLELKKNRPDVTVTWEQTVCGQTFSSEAEEIDLSGSEVTDLETLKKELSYFPELELVFLGECGLDNELLAAWREQVRDRYKVVWTVACGSKLKTRTDATTFMPVREHVYYFNDEEAYNLRYCEDMVCIDIGHMSIRNIDFVEYMPNLEYLILAHTQLQDIEPISTCKKLKFLELDWSPVRDLTPLKGCTALEDLNLGKVYADFTPIGEMTWLKNLWMVECSTAARYRMTQALPDTKVMVTGAATVANGWRNLDNYYKMRDLLGMYYMSW